MEGHIIRKKSSKSRGFTKCRHTYYTVLLIYSYKQKSLYVSSHLSSVALYESLWNSSTATVYTKSVCTETHTKSN